jgi:hypothetical protein
MNQTTNGSVDHTDGSGRVVEMTVRQQLTKLSDGVDQHLEKLRASLVAAEAQALVQKAIYAALPDTLPLAPKSLSTNNVYRADASFVFEVTTRDQVLQLLEALPGVPVVLVQAGSTTFIPEERYVADARPSKVAPVNEVAYRFQTWCGHNREEFTWWTRLADKLVQVEARTKEGARAPVKVQSTTHQLSAHDSETRWHYDGLPKGILMQWSGGDHRNVAPLSVHLARGASMKDALAASQTFNAQVTSSCHC